MGRGEPPQATRVFSPKARSSPTVRARACVRACIHECVCVCIHECVRARVRSYTHAWVFACMHAELSLSTRRALALHRFHRNNGKHGILGCTYIYRNQIRSKSISHQGTSEARAGSKQSFRQHMEQASSTPERASGQQQGRRYHPEATRHGLDGLKQMSHPPREEWRQGEADQ